MKYTLSWKDDRRGDCLIELWQEGDWWRWFYRPADIAFYQQGRGNVKLPSMKKYLREKFYPPRSVKFCLTKRAADVCPVCAGKRHIQTKSRGLVKCASCNGTGQRG